MFINYNNVNNDVLINSYVQERVIDIMQYHGLEYNEHGEAEFELNEEMKLRGIGVLINNKGENLQYNVKRHLSCGNQNPNQDNESEINMVLNDYTKQLYDYLKSLEKRENLYCKLLECGNQILIDKYQNIQSNKLQKMDKNKPIEDLYEKMEKISQYRVNLIIENKNNVLTLKLFLTLQKDGMEYMVTNTEMNKEMVILTDDIDIDDIKTEDIRKIFDNFNKFKKGF